MKKICNSPKRLLAVLLAVIVLISAINIAFVFANASQEPALNYPLLNGFSEGSAPNTDGTWTYGVRDFAEKAVFEVSTNGFEAPLADWNADRAYATVNWNSFEGADRYILNIYEDIRRIYSISLTDTQWKSSVAEPLEGGETYEMQVLAYKSGEQIAASYIRSFKAHQAQNVVPYYINAFNAESELDNVTFSRFESKSIVNNQLVMKTDSSKNYARIYLQTQGISRAKAKAVMFYVKSESDMLQTFRVAFGETASDLVYTSSGQTDDVYYVSAANPNETVVSSVSGTTTPKNETGYAEFCEGGYYVIIPLSLYDADIRTGIAEGTYNYCEILLQNIKYRDSATGNFTSATNFDGTNIAFDDVCLIDDIDGYIKQLSQEYNKVNDPDKYNEILKEELEETSYPYVDGVSGVGSVLVADQFEINKLSNQTAGTGYKLFNSKSARKVLFSATSKGSFNYGSHLKFTAPADGIYDLGGTISVVNNTDITDAVVKYRIIHINERLKETVISGNGEWSEIAVNSADMNPEGEFPVSQIALKLGESVAIEVYEDSAEDDTVIDISLGNPTATVVTGTSNYSGSSTVYKYSDYSDNRIFHIDGSNIGTHNPITNRWNTYIIEKSDGGVVYNSINTVRSAWKMIYNNNIVNTGYYYESGKVQVKKANCGVAFSFSVPKTGDATVSLPLKSSSAGMFIRILKNGEKIYPASNDWEEMPRDASVLKTVTETEAGDIISIEIYGNSTTANCIIDETPSITIADAKDANNLDDCVFSPLWERPYGDSDYVGECIIPDGSVWEYEILDARNNTSSKVDFYDSYNKFLYKQDIETCGYIFDEDSFKFAFGNGNKGMSLIFNVPARGYYDLSSNFTISSGAGRIKLRILKNDQKIWPQLGDWEEFTESTVFDAIEIGANSGDKIKIEAYAENCSNSVLNMAVPAFIKLTNRQYTETGNITVYNPKDYIAFEKGYNGDFEQLSSRFTYFFDEKAVSKTYSADQRFSLDQNNYFTFKDGKINVLADSIAEIKYTSVMSGKGELSLSVSDSAEVKILKNNDVLSDWADVTEVLKELDLVKGDIITLQVKTGGKVITVDSFNISLIGQHNNTNSPEDDGFFAAYADPYSDKYYSEEYDGTYKKNDSEYWNFDFYNSEKDVIKSANAYKTGENHKLYRKEYTNAGYYFGDTLLTADINVKDGYGIALGFTSPREDTFNSRYGLRLITENEEAVIKLRMIKISAESGETEQIWPSDGNWNEKTVKTGEDIEIPYAELSLKIGDTVYLEAYAVSASADKITVNLVSPAFLKENVTNVLHSDIKAKIYNAHDYGPYNYIEDYNGKYIPMDNRWNFRFAEFSSVGEISKLFDADSIRTDTSNEHSFYSSLNNIPQYIWKTTTKTVNVRNYVSDEKNIGSVIEFACPYSGEINLTAAASVGTIDIEGAVLKYRVIKKSMTDGSVSTVWPDNGTDEWEILDSLNTQSKCIDIGLNVELGDVLEYQCYWDIATEKLSAYLSENSAEYWRGEFNISPAVTAVEWINTDRVGFDAVTQFLPDYAVSPYWRVQYSLDENSTDWKYATQYKNIYWQSNLHTNIGISKNSLYAIEHMNNSFDGYNPTLAWLFNVRTDGYVRMSGTKVITLASTSTEGYSALIRITVNNKQVYPDAGWTEVERDSNVKLKDVRFEVKNGDEIRFEVKSSKPLENEHMIRLAWTPAFTLSDEKSIYTETEDIYNMLDAKMYKIFTGLDGSEEFDMNLAQNKLLSQQFKDWLSSLVPFTYESSTDSENEENIKEDDYYEWTEEIYTPGGGWKKTIRYTKTAWWVYALIIGGSVIAAGGVVTTVVIVVKKKKSKKLQISNEK